MLYIFDKDDNLLEIIEDFQNDEMNRELNSDWTYNFKIDINTSKNIKKPNKVGFFDDDEFYLFLIDEVNDTIFSEDIKSVYCINDMYSINGHIIEDKRCVDYSIDKALEKALEGTDYVVGELDTFNVNTVSFYYISSLAALKKIVEVYNAEYMPRIEYNKDTNKIERYIDVKVKIGQDTGLRFTYDTNIEEIKRNEASDNHYTVLYGRGASLQMTDEEGQETGGYTRLIDFSEVEWSKEKGDPCDKPLGQKYVEDVEAIEKYGRIEGIYENKDIESTSELLQATYNALQETKEINVSYDVSVEDLRDIKGFEHYKYTLGDRIIILDDDYDINLESRIIKETLSLKNKTKVVTLGYIFSSISSNNASNIVSGDEEKENDEDRFSDEDFPNTLPEPPVLSIDREGFASISLSWTFENKPYYVYELYASKLENFNPTENHLVWRGHGSAFLHEVNFNETWYYKVRVVNSHGQYTDFSNQVSATTYKIDDATQIFEKAAIKEALIESLNADKIIAGKVKGTFIDARNLSVTDGNGNITFEVSSDGLIKLIQGLISIDEKGIKINLIDSEENILGYVLYDGQGVQIFTSEDNAISHLTREGSFIDKLVVNDIKCNEIMKIANRSGCSTQWYVASQATGDGTGRNEQNKANSLNDVLRRIRNYGLYFTQAITINVESGILNENIVIQDFHGTRLKINIAKGVKFNCDKFVIEDCTSRIYICGDTNEVLAVDSDVTSDEINSRGNITVDSNLFDIRNCNYVKIEGLTLKSNNQGDVIQAWDKSDVILSDCDINNFSRVSYTVYLSKVSICNCRGSVDTLGYVSYGGELSSTAHIPKCANSEIVEKTSSGIWHKQDTYVQLDTLQSETTTTETSTNITDIFELTDLYTKVEGTGQAVNGRKGYVGQGRFQNYKAHRGYIELPITNILSVLDKKNSYTLKLRMTRLNTKHGYAGKIPHPVIRAIGTNIQTDYWDSNITFDRGDTNDIVLPDAIVNAIKQGATRLELWAETNQQQQYSFYENINLIIEGANKQQVDIKDVTFTGADEFVECAMTYWRNCTNESDGTDWSEGTVYRSNNTVLSGKCESEKDVTYSFYEKCGTKYYKAIDCSTLVGMALRGWTYEKGAYGNKEAFTNLRNNRLLCNSEYSWAIAPTTESGGVARDASQLAEYFYNLGWIVPLSSINSDNNYSGLKKGDILFYARKNSDGTWIQPNRFMNISHVGICSGISSSTGKMNLIESTHPTTKVHTIGGKDFYAGVIVRSIEAGLPDTMVLVARIKG